MFVGEEDGEELMSKNLGRIVCVDIEIPKHYDSNNFREGVVTKYLKFSEMKFRAWYITAMERQ